MKILLTDFGKEFNNELLDTMLSNIGVEHKSTTSFNPRSNGLTERLNLSLITALRKHAETNHQSWHKWLDWVLFAYRTRVHSSTGFCPFSLTFGKKANTFKDWRNEPDKNSELDLIARSSEIKLLFEKTRPKAIDNIEKSQIAQKSSQDKRHNVLVDTLHPGTKVMVRNDDKLVKK